MMWALPVMQQAKCRIGKHLGQTALTRVRPCRHCSPSGRTHASEGRLNTMTDTLKDIIDIPICTIIPTFQRHKSVVLAAGGLNASLRCSVYVQLEARRESEREISAHASHLAELLAAL